MKRHEWLALLCAYVLFLLLGAAAFYFIERGQEAESVQQILQLRSDIHEELMVGVDNATLKKRSALLERISDQCSVNLTNTTKRPPTVWNEYNSLFFCFTVVTTIGYGHIAPVTLLGRMICIVYALIGIPLNGILLKNISDLFSSKVIRAQQRIKERKYQTRLEVFIDTLFYLAPAVLVFFLVPSGLFIVLENWNFYQAIYYTFITLTTIGFGDLVAGKVEYPDGVSAWIWLYKIGLVIWILFGLAYLLMVLDFISRALYSKKIVDLEKKMARGIAKTKERLRKNVVKEVVQMRKILNELALNRMTPVRSRRKDAGVLMRTRSDPSLAVSAAASAAGGPADPAGVGPPEAGVRRAGSASQLEQLTASSSAGDTVDLPAPGPVPAAAADSLIAAVTAAGDGEPGAPPGPEVPAPLQELPSVDAALELLLQATVTLEWEVESTGSGEVAPGSDTSGGGAEEGALLESSPRPSVWGRLSRAWRHRPSLLPGRRSSATRQPSPPPHTRTTTTTLADVMRLLRLATNARRQEVLRERADRRATVAAARPELQPEETEEPRRATVQLLPHWRHKVSPAQTDTQTPRRRSAAGWWGRRRAPSDPSPGQTETHPDPTSDPSPGQTETHPDPNSDPSPGQTETHPDPTSDPSPGQTETQVDHL